MHNCPSTWSGGQCCTNRSRRCGVALGFIDVPALPPAVAAGPEGANLADV